MASVVHAPGVQAHLTLRWWIIVTFRSAGVHRDGRSRLVLGTSFEPGNIGLMFGFIILPDHVPRRHVLRLDQARTGHDRRLGTAADPRAGHPLIYVNEGMRRRSPGRPHMHLYVIYPVVFAFAVVFLAIGLRNFRRRVLS